MWCALLAPMLLLGADPAAAIEPALTPWLHDVKVSSVAGPIDAHTTHAYFNTSPESPDGQWVLYFRSTTPEGHRGQVCIQERATGKVRLLADNVTTEDAHRVACQQWSQGGKTVVFHDLRPEGWVVAAIDVDSGEERILAKDRLVSWGQPSGELVPIYGPHWAPGEFRDLQFVNVRTGEITTPLTDDAVRQQYSQWIAERFDNRPTSIFFPILSPDEKAVFFKIAAATGKGFQDPGASVRAGLVCYDLEQKKFRGMFPDWGHPAWHKDSRHVVDVRKSRLVVVDTVSGEIQHFDQLPRYPGTHPSYSPDGKLFVTDTKLQERGEPAGIWGIAVGAFPTSEETVIHRFSNARGASSWRGPHPHPVFSADGQRIYFNVSADGRTRLFVAESAK